MQMQVQGMKRSEVQEVELENLIQKFNVDSLMNYEGGWNSGKEGRGGEFGKSAKSNTNWWKEFCILKVELMNI